MKKMNIISVLALFLVLFVALGTASATTDDIVVNDANDNTIMDGTISNGPSVDNGTFTDLKDDVYAAISQGRVLELEKDYVYNSTSDFNLSKGILINNSLTVNGNGHIIDGSGLARVFIFESNSKVSISNVTFINANANGENGGAIYNLGDLTIDYSTFLENSKDYQLGKEFYGGAIYSGPGSNLRVNNSVFRKNCEGAEFINGGKLESRYIDGGAIATQNATVVIDNTLFDENTARWGSVALFENGNVQLTNSNITNSNVYAGAFYISANTKIVNCKFENNEAKYVGSQGCLASGADLCIMGSNFKVDIVDSSFDHSKVTSSVAGAGSIHIQGGSSGNINVNINNSEFTNVLSPERAAIYVTGGTLKLDNVTFTNCSAKIGGAIYNKNATVEIIKSEFTNCSAENGGAIYNNGTLIIDNSIFTENFVSSASEMYGGVIYSGAGSSLNINNSVFKDNCKGAEFINSDNNTEANPIDGGVIYCIDAILLIDNSLFDANTGRWGSVGQFIDSNVKVMNSNITNSNVYAGSFYINGNVTFSNCKFENNEAKYVGSPGCLASGADLCIMSSDANIVLDGSTFNHSKVTSSAAGAGSIHIQAGTHDIKVTIKNSKFSNVVSPERAAIYNNNASLIIDKGVFENCSAYYGGAIYNVLGNVTVTNSNFTDCSAYYGGAIYNYDYLNISDCEFVGCNATDGGAIYNYDYLNISDCEFVGCNATYGGAIYSRYDTNLINSIFINNSASRGGGIYVGYAFNLMDSIFINNTANNFGGAVFIINADGNLNNLTFRGNTAQKGGALEISSYCEVNLTNSNFYDNFASGAYKDGGAIYVNCYNLNINGTNFFNNTAKNGGAIYLYGGSLTISNSKFTNCSAENGGAIYNKDEKLTINDCDFYENFVNSASEMYGGVIYSGARSTLNINNSVFKDNCKGAEFINNDTGKLEAKYIDGGVIYCKDATLLIDNSLFDANTGRWGSVGQFIDSNVKVMNSNITNSNVYAGSFYINGNVTFSNCKFENNEAKYVGSPGCLASGADLCIMSSDANIVLDDCTFDHSKVTSSAAGAGSIHIQGGTYDIKVTIKNSKFSNVLSPERAAVYVSNADLEVINVSFVNCSAKIGGAIYNKDGTVLVNYSRFINCYAINGSAIYNNGSLTCFECIFDCNNSTSVIYNSGNANLNTNYWAMNYTTAEEFINSNLIDDVNDDIPDNWLLMSITPPEEIIIGEANNFTIAIDKLFNGTDIVDYPNVLFTFNYSYIPEDSGFIIIVYSEFSSNEIVRFIKVGTVNVTVDAKNITYGEVASFNSTVVDSVSGNNVSGVTEFLVYDENNNLINQSEWDNLAAGTYKVLACFGGNELYYNATSENLTFTVSKVTPVITLEDVEDINYGEIPNIVSYVTGVDNQTIGNATIAVLNIYNDPVNYTSILPVGIYTVVATYSSNQNYTEAIPVTKKFLISHANVTVFDIKVDNVTYGNDAIFVVSNATGVDGEKLNGTVTIIINGDEFTFNITNGNGSYNIGKLAGGIYNVNATLEVDKYNDISNTTVFEVNPIYPAIIIEDVGNVIYGTKPVFNATVLGLYAQIIDADVIFSVYDNETFIPEEEWDKLDVGTYTVLVTFLGNENYTALNESKNFTVVKADTCVECDSITMTAYTSKNLVITLKDLNGKLISGKNLTVKFNGKNYVTTTDENGVAKLTITASTVKTYPVTITFDGDKNYYGSMTSANVVVKTAYVTISDVIKAAKTLKTYASKNKKLPTTIQVGSLKVSVAQFSYLMSGAIKNINAKKKVSTKIKVIPVSATNKKTNVKVKSLKKQYLTIVNNLYSAGAKGKLPSYITVSSKKVGFNDYTYGLANILTFYNTNSRLPNYVIFTSEY